MAASKITLASDDESSKRFKAPEDLYPNWQLGLALSWSRRGPGSDRDGDGLPDFKDQCPRDAEDRDGWEDADGCPDRDNDADGIRDEFDASPLAREDFDGWLDSDGAPDPDNDGDGIADAEDRCPGEAEDKDGIADADGCPEDDADKDGVPDNRDECPDEAENLDGVEDADGCPERTSSAPRGLPSVEWEGAAVAPKPASYYDLNQLAERMRRDPTLHVEIRVHHSPADVAGARPDLPLLRAEYLKAFLVATGIDPTRVAAVGLPAPSSKQAGASGRTEVEVVETAPREK
jgi:outer membrane protein OmpA-like peptidoglycan-associated protein